jgi:hypothetical protein
MIGVWGWLLCGLNMGSWEREMGGGLNSYLLLIAAHTNYSCVQTYLYN